MASKQSETNIYDVLLAIYDKNPILVGMVLLILVLTPVWISKHRLLIKKEEVNLEKYKYILDRRKSRANRRRNDND